MSDRAVSEVISYVLVFALIVSAVGIISVSGLSTLQDVRNDEQLANAERAFDIMSDNIEDIHRRGAPSRATEISLGEAELATGSNVTMEVEVDDGSGFTTVRERNIRPIIYNGEEERELVYVGGAIFRTNRDSGVMVQEPPFILNNDRIHVPIVGINRPQAQSLGGSTVLVRTQLNSKTVEYQDVSGSSHQIRISITGSGTDSTRASLWQDYFEPEFSCSVSGSDVECTSPSWSPQQVYVVDHDISVNIDP